MTSYPFYRRRQYGPRCASPPTFVCYELPLSDYSRSASPTSSDNYSGEDDDGRDSASDSENSDEEDVTSSGSSNNGVIIERMTESNENPDVESMELGGNSAPAVPAEPIAVDPKDIPCPPSGNEDEDEDDDSERRRAEKREGKKKEVVGSQPGAAPTTDGNADPPVKPKHKKRRSKRRPAPEVRPILTIRSSQGFVWNQDLFVPPYAKDRYIASSPPSSIPVRGGTSSPGNKLVNNNFFSSSNAADFEVECVEIRIDEDDMEGIIPRR